MGELIYAMQFKGKATPTNESGTTLKANTTASSCRVNSAVGPEGLYGYLGATDGGEAQFESEVNLTDKGTFQESGTISFGQKHRLRFSTIGEGHLGSSPDPKLQHGAVIWKVDGGEGQFEGASGIITSNFFVSDVGEVTDNHFGVIFLK